MATWPAELPVFMLDGTSLEPAPQSIETGMEVGPPKLRRRTSVDVVPLQASVVLTGAQVATLETFYLTTLSGGSATFTHPHPVTGASATFQFRGRYSIVPVAGNGIPASRRFRASFQLVIVG